MTQAKSHNRIYFVTALSIYVGLVLIGASPQVIAQSNPASDTASYSFEFNTRTDNVRAKLKYRQNSDSGDIVPFNFAGSSHFSYTSPESHFVISEREILADDIFAANQRILTTNLFPRASIRRG